MENSDDKGRLVVGKIEFAPSTPVGDAVLGGHEWFIGAPVSDDVSLIAYLYAVEKERERCLDILRLQARAKDAEARTAATLEGREKAEAVRNILLEVMREIRNGN